MFGGTKLIPIKDIVLDQEIYPRANVWWQTAYKYSKEMKAGAKFPPICVASLNGKYVLIDGKNRIDAYTKNGEKYITAEILQGKNKQELFLEAIKRNIAHGQALTPYDKRKVIMKLEEWHYDVDTISKIVQVPATEIKQFVASSLTYSTTGNPIILKSALSHLSGTNIPSQQVDMIESDQEIISSSSELSMVNQLIQIFSNDAFPRTDNIFLSRLEKLNNLIADFLLKNPPKRKGKFDDEDIEDNKADGEKVKKKRGRPKKDK